MAKDEKPLQNFTSNVEQAAQKNIEQAQGAMENYFIWLQKAMSTSPWGQTDVLEKWKSYAERNVAATQEYLQTLSQAKDFSDVVRIQTEFMHAQFESFVDQVRGLSEPAAKAAKGTIKVPPVA